MLEFVKKTTVIDIQYSQQVKRKI